jgi:two-component system, cell cycle sensor histidine kinase and response regulator CckA
MGTPLRVLLVEDSEEDAKVLCRHLESAGYEPICERVTTSWQMARALEGSAWDVIISDYKLREFDLVSALALYKRLAPELPFIVVSGLIDEEQCVSALAAGALDFVPKGKLGRLVPAIERGRADTRTRQASEARYRNLFDSSPLPMWVFDLATLKFLAVNDAAVRLYGYAREEFARLTLEAIRPREDVARLHRDIAERRVVDEGHRWRHLKKDGSMIMVEIKSHDMEFEGRVARLVLVNDVTERVRVEEHVRKIEEQLRHAQKMEAIGRLAGGVAHDFNNLLSVILSYSSMALADLDPGHPICADLEEIKRASERAADVTRQLLSIGREQVTQARLVDVNEVIAGMENLLRRLLGEDIELSVLGARDAGKIRADPGQIGQVIMNLVINARDAMPQGGKLSIETQGVELDAQYAAEHLDVKPGPHVMLAVSDSGVGMDAATRARIFEPFFTTKDVGKGTGLGLSIVFGIVKQSHGHISVYSEPGHGTTFKIFFPRDDRAERRPRFTSPSAHSPQVLTGSETILLVEDDEQVRTMIRTVLKRNGYQVIETQNAGEAFLASEQHPASIHLLLSDMVMPRMSGRQLAQRLIAARPAMKVLFMSGYTGHAIVHHGVLDPASAFMQKPITPDALLRRVREVLDSR